MSKMLLMPATALLLGVAVPLCAQGGRMGGMGGTAAVGSGKLPPGWMMRFDPRPGPAPAPTAVSFVATGGGYHIKSAPNGWAIYYNPEFAAHGNYTVSATFSQARSMGHETYGLFIGGSHLQDSAQAYLYFVIRPKDGAMLISHRVGVAAPTAIQALTPDPAVNKENASTGAATNTLAIRVNGDSVHFLANGKQVRAYSRSQLEGAATDGQVGIRANHMLDIQVDGFSVTRGH